MKKLLSIFFCLFFLLSCQKDFKRDEKNRLAISNADDLSYAINGMNYRFAELTRNIIVLFGHADDMTFTGDLESFCFYNWKRPEANDTFLLKTYLPLYQTIASANEIIEKSKNVETDKRCMKMLGEVYFMRAYSYFWLTRCYGQIPLITNTQINYNIPKSTFEEIYNLITNDLKIAIQLLPSSAVDSRIPNITPHKGTAKALLAEVYLTMSGYPLKNIAYYEKAAELAGEVIDNAGLYGYGLLSDYANLWDGKHEINKETIFAIYSGSNSSLSKSPDTAFVNFSYKPIPFQFLQKNNSCDLYSGVDFYNSFPISYRKQVSLHSLRYSVVNKDTQWIWVDQISSCSPIQYRKYYSTESENNLDLNTNSKYSCANNMGLIYFLRYAHVLLTYAEAKARTGVIDAKAYECVNMIRRRANKADIYKTSQYDLPLNLTNEQFINSVINERAWEFCAEPEGRWFDILRLEKVSYIKKSKINSPGAIYPFPINEKTFFYPIPSSEHLLNDKLKK